MRFKLPLFFAVFGLSVLPSPSQADEPYCREYTKKVQVGGKMEESYGTACMKPDGAWEVQNPEPRITTAPTIIREEVITYVPQYRPAYRPNYTVITFGDRGRDHGRDRSHGHGYSHGYGHGYGYKRPSYHGNGYSHHYSNGYSFNFKL